MSTSECPCRNLCTTVALIISLVIGIITAFLRITATITLTPAFLWAVLGVAVVYLAVLLLSSSCVKCCDLKAPCCLNSTLPILLGSILATALLSIVLLAIEFVATSIVGAILAGLLLFSFFLMLSETACLIRCFVISKY